jgi:uncharacterized membrane protein
MAEAVKKSDDNIMAALAYFLAPLTSIIFYVMYKDKGNKFVMFHAIQSAIFSVGLFVVFIGWSLVSMVVTMVTGGILGLCMLPISLLMMVAFFGAWIFLMYKAYSGVKYKLPMIGDMAEKYAG